MISHTTFQDVIDHLGGNPTDQARRDCVRAILESCRDLANAFNWTYLYTPGRLVTNPAHDSSASK